MNLILISMGVLGVTALVAAILLYFVSQFFKVEEDPRIDLVAAVLPGANCGGCGFAVFRYADGDSGFGSDHHAQRGGSRHSLALRHCALLHRTECVQASFAEAVLFYRKEKIKTYKITNY